MKGMKKLIIAMIAGAGLMTGGAGGAEEIVLPEVDEIFYEQDGVSEDIALLPEEHDTVIELSPEVIVESLNYYALSEETLTEEEVLEALSGLLRSEHAVERALAVHIAGTGRITGIILNALSDADEAVRNEAEFFTHRLLLSNASF